MRELSNQELEIVSGGMRSGGRFLPNRWNDSSIRWNDSSIRWNDSSIRWNNSSISFNRR